MKMFNSLNFLQRVSTVLILLAVIVISCKKDEEVPPNQVTNFKLSSPEIKADSLLPADYTCDGSSSTLPLQWTGYPSNTAYFAVIMHHVASPTDIHWYWILYNIPPTITSLPKNVSQVGTLGSNSVNDKTEYAPPCSQGPGLKAYTITVYALSEKVTINVAPAAVNREVLLNAMQGKILATASMTVWYSRIVK
jgi:Raf kinase inhibitor-like YbhB/YbcL family protein